jgi:hypothetical protein
MSTEATGDGRTDPAGAAEADIATGGTEPSVTVVAEPDDASSTAWETAAPSAWGADDNTEGTAQADDTPSGDEAPENGEAPGTDDAAVGVEAEEPDETAEDYEDDEASEYDETLEYDEEYDETLEYAEEYDEDEDVAEPRRARRWPRLLLALGFVVLGAAIVGGAVAIVGSVTHGFKKPVKVTYTKSALFSLKTGDCFDPHGQSYSLLSCNSPHEAEVFATFTLGGSQWPGDAAVAKDASSGCATRLSGYLNPQLAISLSQAYVYPDSVAWQAGTRTVICEVRAPSGELTGSVQEASATAS